MARYDKYDPKVGGFRAPLAADWAPGDVGDVVGVGLNTDGAVVKGAGVTGIVGVLILTKAYKAGHIADVMTSGEIVEFLDTAGANDAGTVYFAEADGDVSHTSAAGKTRVGHTVEADRLVVRVVAGAVAA